jgi:hypothetical protein
MIKFLQVTLILSSLLLVSCGGGSDGGTATSSTSSTDQTTNSSSPVITSTPIPIEDPKLLVSNAEFINSDPNNILISGPEIEITFNHNLQPDSLRPGPSANATIRLTGAGEDLPLIIRQSDNKITILFPIGASLLPNIDYTLQIQGGESGVLGTNNEKLETLNDPGFPKAAKLITFHSENAIAENVIRLKFDLTQTQSQIFKLQDLTQLTNIGFIDEISISVTEIDKMNSNITNQLPLQIYRSDEVLPALPLDSIDAKTFYLNVIGDFDNQKNYIFIISSCITSIRQSDVQGNPECVEAKEIQYNTPDSN